MKLTIITINLNNRDGLRRTLESVVGQTCQDFEYVVIDGGSTDGSREVIMEHQERLAYWCSEPDRGIYNAMNKGVAHATGDYCLFLNSGDYLYNKDVVKEVLPELDGRFDIVYGRIKIEDSYGNVAFPKKEYKHDANAILLIKISISHQSIFFKREIIGNNPYDENYQVIADKKLLYECYFNQNCTFHHIPTVISVFKLGGVSGTQACKDEIDALNIKTFPKRLVDDISLLDPELLYLWGQIPTSYRFRQILIFTLALLIKAYKCLKK
jgi:glycosyltransferase involved in cell wall biosynthesis